MAPLPTVTVRARQDHFDIIRKVAARLKTDPAFADTLDAFLSQPVAGPLFVPPPEPDSPADDLRQKVEELARRVDELERNAGKQSVTQNVTRRHTAGMGGGRVTRRNTEQYDIEDFARPIAPAPAEPSDSGEVPSPSLPAFNAALAAAMKAEGLKAPAVARRMAEKGHGVTAEAVRLWLKKGGGITPACRAVLAEIFPALKEIEQ